MTYGYVRVSTRDQNEARQLDAIRAHGIGDESIFIDHESGKDFNRPAFKRMLRRIRKGDGIVVQSIDRFGRNYKEVLEQWRDLTQRRQVSIMVLDMPILNTDVQGDLTHQLISDIVLQLLSYVAETERAFIRKRQAQGIAAAKLRGVRFGAPRKPVATNFGVTYLLWRSGECSLRSAARSCEVSRGTFLRWAAAKEANMV